MSTSESLKTVLPTDAHLEQEQFFTRMLDIKPKNSQTPSKISQFKSGIYIGLLDTEMREDTSKTLVASNYLPIVTE